MVEKIIPSTEKKVADKQNAVDEDEFMLAVAEAGGSDYEDAGDEWIVYTAPNDLMAVKNALEAQDIEVKGAELTMIPTTPTEVDPKGCREGYAPGRQARGARRPPERVPLHGYD